MSDKVAEFKLAPAANLDRVHFIGIGGAGMSALARILLAQGKTVSGSDQQDSATVAELRELGAKIAVGHDRDNLALAGALPTVVVVSFAAIAGTNPELVAAREQDIQVIRRSDLLAQLMEGKTQILFAGTHGKTSSTSMAISGWREAGLDPSFAVGGVVTGLGINGYHGSDQFFIAEADESDASFLGYQPTVAVVTNIEPDHLDFYGSAAQYQAAFAAFAKTVVPGGHLVVCLNDDGAAKLGEQAAAAGQLVAGYGTIEAVLAHPTVPCACIVGEEYQQGCPDGTITLSFGGRDYLAKLPLPGAHMALNAAGVITAAWLVGYGPTTVAVGVGKLKGVGRRFEPKADLATVGIENCVVYDDYAHHPTEVAATLAAARAKAQAQGGRVVVAFQPHLYSRTAAFASEFAAALSTADQVVLCPIYGARETAQPGVSAALIAEQMQDQTKVCLVADLTQAAQKLAELAAANDVVLTVGAGSITTVGPQIAQFVPVAAEK